MIIRVVMGDSRTTEGKINPSEIREAQHDQVGAYLAGFFEDCEEEFNFYEISVRKDW